MIVKTKGRLPGKTRASKFVAPMEIEDRTERADARVKDADHQKDQRRPGDCSRNEVKQTQRGREPSGSHVQQECQQDHKPDAQWHRDDQELKEVSEYLEEPSVAEGELVVVKPGGKVLRRAHAELREAHQEGVESRPDAEDRHEDDVGQGEQVGHPMPPPTDPQAREPGASSQRQRGRSSRRGQWKVLC
jgi:hypothetical protein